MASQENPLIENDYAFAIPDKYPITEGHTLIIPKRHFASYFDSIQVEHDAIYGLLKMLEKQLLEKDPLITGFDIGVKCGGSRRAEGLPLPYSFDSTTKRGLAKLGERSKSK